MKKTILSVVLILALCFTIIGCPKDPEDDDDFPSDFPSALVTILKGMGVTSFIGPSGGAYSSYKHIPASGEDGELLGISWVNCTEAMLDAYKAAWDARSVTDKKNHDMTAKFPTLTMANIAFYETGGEHTQLSFTIPNNSILFSALK
ncbi:MAG: hypothetical protein FWD22_06905 [Treponema sp.]|nr:hypothetical protein [Treponema sp.]